MHDAEIDDSAPKTFVGTAYRTNRPWWNDLSDSDGEGFFPVKLGQLHKDVAMGLKSDEPHEEAVPTRPKTSGVVPRDFSHAQELLARYNDGSNSWLRNHFPSLTPNLALLIRRFASPPPVLMLKKGDLVLNIEETCEPECHRRIIFRKKATAEET